MSREDYLHSKVTPLKTDGLDSGALRALCKDIFNKIKNVESDKYDIEVKMKRLNSQVFDLNAKLREPGKFMKPSLKKVDRTDLKFEKLVERKNKKLDLDIELKAAKKADHEETHTRKESHHEESAPEPEEPAEDEEEEEEEEE